MRIGLMVSGTVLCGIATGLAAYALWLLTNDYLILGVVTFGPAMTNSTTHWIRFAIPVVLSTVLYLAAGVALWKGLTEEI